ncbi:MAG: thiamine-phosphate kinase, partial [Planctomycetota bacterium]
AKGPVLRSGARVGDVVVVSGTLGTGRHLDFTPRVAEARALVEQCDVGAMIDISDGLSTDMHHILDASGVGCRLDPDAIPRAGTLEQALDGGEDYELLATVRPGALPDGFTVIGEVIAEGAWIGDEPLVARGWEHGA